MKGSLRKERGERLASTPHSIAKLAQRDSKKYYRDIGQC